MKKKYIFLLCFTALFFQNITSQTKQLSPKAEISIITVGPGNVLYEKFGHTAFRVNDPNLAIDDVYNYGIFEFNSQFYVNFTKGNLNYQLARYPFFYFVKSNQEGKRWLKSQTLNITQKDKQRFYDFLENNAKPENIHYPYDPFFNNCATKPRDILQNILQEKLSLNTDFESKKQSLRQLMNSEIHWNTWGSLGINVALGSKLDKIASANEYMYLPDYVYESLKKAVIYKENQPQDLVAKEQLILNFKEIKPKSDFISPFLIFIIFMFLGLYITYKDYKNKTRTRWLDFTLFFSSGLIGVLIIFLWFFTSHSTAPNNFNFLWAFAPNLFIAFILLKKVHSKWVRKYLIIQLLFLFIIPIIWLLKVQLFSLSLLPLLVLFTIRYFALQHRLLALKK